MGLFDFFKRHKGEHRETRDGITYWAPDPISNEEYQAIRQKEMQHWERKYDFSTVQGINSIPVPTRKTDFSGTGSITGQLDYYLMLKAGQYETAGQVELALACYRKANELMPMCAVSSYSKERYMRLPRYLRKLRRFDEARVEEAKIALIDPFDGVFERSQAEFIADMLAVGHTKKHAKELYAEYKAERDAEHQKVLYRADYDWLWEFLPEICPKSFSGYMRMKNLNSKNYQKIIAEAQKLGRYIL